MNDVCSTDERVAIRCEVSHKRLADIDIQSLYFYCKQCHAPHRIGKEELINIWLQICANLPQDRNVYVSAQEQHKAS